MISPKKNRRTKVKGEREMDACLIRVVAASRLRLSALAPEQVVLRRSWIEVLVRTLTRLLSGRQLGICARISHRSCPVFVLHIHTLFSYLLNTCTFSYKTKDRRYAKTLIDFAYHRYICVLYGTHVERKRKKNRCPEFLRPK